MAALVHFLVCELRAIYIIFISEFSIFRKFQVDSIQDRSRPVPDNQWWWPRSFPGVEPCVKKGNCTVTDYVSCIQSRSYFQGVDDVSQRCGLMNPWVLPDGESAHHVQCETRPTMCPREYPNCRAPLCCPDSCRNKSNRQFCYDGAPQGICIKGTGLETSCVVDYTIQTDTFFCAMKTNWKRMEMLFNACGWMLVACVIVALVKFFCAACTWKSQSFQCGAYLVFTFKLESDKLYLACLLLNFFGVSVLLIYANILLGKEGHGVLWFMSSIGYEFVSLTLAMKSLILPWTPVHANFGQDFKELILHRSWMDLFTQTNAQFSVRLVDALWSSEQGEPWRLEKMQIDIQSTDLALAPEETDELASEESD